MFGFFLRIVNLHKKGQRNARNITVKAVNIEFTDLPNSFDGYKILHMTDLHLDGLDGIDDIICERIGNLKYDLCVLTGDYRVKTHGGFKQILEPMRKITKATNAEDGILAVLGNHDTYLMVSDLEKMGIRILSNETVTVDKNKERIAITGTDDPHYHYTDQAVNCLEKEIGGFKIVLAHSPELYDVAAENNYSLYLCGHTHGGQICLPGGIPVFTHVYTGRRFCRGLWSYSSMKGYTSQGCATVAIPIRFNSEAEITLITLEKNTS